MSGVGGRTPSDAELYEHARRLYGPVAAIRMWSWLLHGGGRARYMRRFLSRSLGGSS